MKFSSRFSFFAFATLFFHQAARVDVVQAAPAMMFFSPPPVARRHLVKEEEEEKATAFSSMHSKSSEETEDNVALYAGRVQNERMVLEKLLVGGLFQSENDDDDDEMKAEVTIVLDQPRWTAEDDEQMAKFLSFSKSSSSTVSSVFAPRFSRFRGGGKQHTTTTTTTRGERGNRETLFRRLDGGELARRKLARRSRAVLELRRRKRGL